MPLVAQRVKLGPQPFERNQPIGEHGFSVLINVKSGEKSGIVLFDTGLNPQNFLYNLDALEINVLDIQAILLSHGHADHAMGLAG
jgi:7,8-dihydropterin-6-yl-methyl-4-(beta-D-ribofuranosyl)aminobenzene 5'-phosphate synthase